MKRIYRTPPASDHFKDGKFHNVTPTPMKAEGISWWKILNDSLHRPASSLPPRPLPAVRTDLRSLSAAPGETVIIWFGHSSYLIHHQGINILIDPVFSGHASPVPGIVNAFPGANTYQPEDMPDIDCMILTHNHYDHLDTGTVTRLAPRTRAFVVPLGVGRTIAGCGVTDQPITEMDWWETIRLMAGMTLTATPARHFSGRGLVRGGSLWTSYVLQLGNDRKIFLGGDSGYEKHFRVIGEKYGPFDLAILECGQYNVAWPHIHMMPEETAQAALDLGAKLLLPVHWAKFRLANHPWNEPIQRVKAAAAGLGLDLTTPMIGEPVNLQGPYPRNEWWAD